ncbi:MAG TPA: methyltransferase [Actinomycetota bacterium]|nr:methyltransferase [Actinomycetota bacterium]
MTDQESGTVGRSAGLGLEIQQRLEQVDRYNEWIVEQFRPFIGDRIVDVGCAIGNITKQFIDRELVIGIDVAREFIDEMRARFGDRPNFRAELIDIADPKIMELADEKIDTIVCANVLEHIEDDGRALTHIQEILVPGGRLLLLVPAFRFLFGTMDVADDHFRRYTKPLVQARLQRAGFEIERLYYMNMVGTLGWFVNGRILKRQIVSNSQYSLYNKIVPVLAKIENRVRPPFGLSVIAVARKPAEVTS